MRKLNEALNQFQEFDIFQNSILLGYRGSKAHGTYIPNSDPNSIDDIDLMGVAIAPLDYYFGLKKFEQFSIMHDVWDVVIYDIRKFCRLLLKCNPNVMSMLYLEDDMFLRKTELGQKLIDNRDLFVSKLAYKSFSGYAYGQLERMTRFEGKALVEKYQFDTKNAINLVRLLEIGIEFMETGALTVKRPNVSYLLDIKRGKYTLEQIQKKADSLFIKMEQVKDKSSLPDKPNYKKVNKLLIELMRESLHES